MKSSLIDITDVQLRNELNKCEFCEEKPCQKACPAHCSPADFIMAAKGGKDFDYQRAATLIISANPLGGICGYTCPDYHCMQACVKKRIDSPVNIPLIQSAIIKRANSNLLKPLFENNINPQKGKILVVGSGPSGLSCAFTLAMKNYQVEIIEKENSLGGMLNYIPESRLSKIDCKNDINFILNHKNIEVVNNTCFNSHNLDNYNSYSAVVLSTGLDKANLFNILGNEYLVYWDEFLKNSNVYDLMNKSIGIIGAGAVAADVANRCIEKNVENIELIALEKLSEFPLTEREFDELKKSDLIIHQRTKVNKVYKIQNKLSLVCSKVKLDISQQKFMLSELVEIADSEFILKNFDFIVCAIGSHSSLPKNLFKKSSLPIFISGDAFHGATTVVEAVASGKNVAVQVDDFLEKNKKSIVLSEKVKSTVIIDGAVFEPVSLECSFFDKKLSSPFILSAAPPTDGYEQVKKAYDSGWAGAVMKTAFNDLDIHIPADYMFLVDNNTYANCDNVSEHSLKRVCQEITQLVKEYPNHLTMASTGGSLTGDYLADKLVWQENTRLLENAGVMGIEYSLSCPQGGDGTEGDIVSQNADLTAKIIDWVMEISNKDIPKLFKLTGAVTAIEPILSAIKKVFDKYPEKKAGVTLANSFPAMIFRKDKYNFQNTWNEGVIVGLSGYGITPISNLSLAKASKLNLHISANGGPMNYYDAANFLALGAETVQFCTIVMKYGYGIVNELKSGLSHLLLSKNLNSVKDLIGIAKPDVYTDFMALSSDKKVPYLDEDLCIHCGNCSRCSYFAIKLNLDGIPQIDHDKCVGCSICTQKCPSGALSLKKYLD